MNKEILNNYILFAHLEQMSIIQTDIYDYQDNQEKESSFLKIGDIFWLNLFKRDLCLAAALENDPFEEFLTAFLSSSSQAISPNKNKFGSNFNHTSPDYKKTFLSDNNNIEEYDFLMTSTPLLTKEVSLKLKKTYISNDMVFEDELEELIDTILKNLNNNIHLEFTKNKPPTSQTLGLKMNCLWKLENSDDFKQGGYVVWAQNYRLKHFGTGKYLIIKNNQLLFNYDRGGEDGVFRLLRSENPDISTKKQNFIEKETVFYLQHVKSGYFIGLDGSDFEETAANKDEKMPKLLKKTFFINSFNLNKIEFEEIWEFQFLITAVQTLINCFKFMKHLTKNVTKEILMSFDDFFSNCLRSLKSLEDFVTNKLVAYISFRQEYGTLSFSRQNLLREQSILGILCLFLYKIFPLQSIEMQIEEESEYERYLINEKIKDFKNFYFSQNKSKKKIGKEMEELYNKKRVIIGNKIYKLLTLASIKNSLNQEYLFKFLNIFEKHLGWNNIITQFFLVLFGQNDKILYELHKKKLEEIDAKSPDDVFLFQNESIREDEKYFLTELIKKTQNSDNFYQQSQSLLIQLLIRFCYLQDHSIYINQEKIFKNLLEGKSFSNYSIFKIWSSSDSNELLLEMKNNEGNIQALSLENFLENIKNNDNNGLQLLKNQLELYSKLCLSRNYNCCKFFGEMFPLNLLVRYLLTRDLDLDIRAIMCSLICNIYVNKDPRIMIVRPNLVRKLDKKLKKSNEPKLTEHFGKKIHNLFTKKQKNKKNSISSIEETKVLITNY